MFTHSHAHAARPSAPADARYDELRADLKKLLDRLDAPPASSFDRIKHAISEYPVAAMAAAVGLAVLAFRVARR